jgi:copper transport protein
MTPTSRAVRPHRDERRSPTRPATHRLAALAGLLLGLLTVLALPTPASAHAALIRTSPVQGTVVPQAPGEVVVTFSERVEPVPGKITVKGPDGKSVEKGQPTVTGTSLHVPVRTDVPRGTYLVSYRVISADSHPVGAGFSYSVGAPSTTAPSSGSDAGRTSPAVAISVSAARYLGYAGLILVAGPALILSALWPHRLDRRPATVLAYSGLGLVGLATLLELYLQAPYSNGTGLFDVAGADLGEVFGSAYGKAHLVRLGVLPAAAILLRPFLAGEGGKLDRALLAILGVIGVGTWSVSGHPATSSASTLTVIADAAHLTSMAIWMGGLLMLTVFLLRKANARELGAILPVWSNWAALAVTVLVLAGTAQALIQIASLDALLHTTYGQLVLLKIGLLAVVLAIASVSRRLVNRRAVVPDGDGDPGREPEPHALRRLRTSVFAEVIGVVVILALTSALVQTTPAHSVTESTAARGTNGIFSVTMTSNLYQLQFDIEPATTGNNEVHLYAYTPAGAPLAIKEWKGTAALPAQGIEPISIPVLAITDSHATGSVTLPSAGSWQLSFTLRTSDIDEATVSTVVNIK